MVTHQTRRWKRLHQCRTANFRAVKFGWGPFGKSTLQEDEAHIEAARAGLGDDCLLLVDAGYGLGEDVEQARIRLPMLESHHVHWLEEPFVGDALHAYAALARECKSVRLAGGEGASNFHLARNLIDHGQIGFVQIDTGRIGGIAPAKLVADYASRNNVTFVNHTFTTHLALAASIAPYAGIATATLCEYPVEASSLATRLSPPIELVDGEFRLREEPGLGVTVDEEAIRDYVVEVEIRVAGKQLYVTPQV